ncbi:heat shock protein beta-6-like [Thrips palmi]|uniref:Heat shock protein beta-6-like n=1 Tax=Thrips palmi TaxID=161013 RepID=A0A6P8ZJF1_THRPL|nr:heat shock protein beta-6-like [Thrips palmi]
MQAMQAPAAVPVEVRDSFTSDPFFLAAREALERCLVELTQKHRQEQNVGFAAAAHCCCCCCGPQAGTGLGNWPLTAFIPCLLCCPNPQVRPAPQMATLTEQISPACLLAGQLSFTPNNFELLLNVQGFQPHEIQVRVKDDHVEVCAEQSALSQQHTFQSTSKRYLLPCPVNADLVQCSLSKDGILLLTAPWK